MKTVFENAHVIAIDKPAGWLSVPSRTGADDPRPVVGKTLEETLGVRLWPVHRLDANVTGLILFAKSEDAHRTLSQWFEGRHVAKTYEALSEMTEDAVPPKASVTWESKLVRGKKRAFEAPHGKPATTHALCRGPAEAGGCDGLLWELHPLTGRSHQLRFELARHGFPILGDTLYGAETPFVGDAIALRSVALAFTDQEGIAALELPQALRAPSLVEAFS